jgi:hypothetical protein
MKIQSNSSFESFLVVIMIEKGLGENRLNCPNLREYNIFCQVLWYRV